MTIGSKKGSQFERDMCKVFSLWASQGEDDGWFWRTPSSGGRATARAKQELNAEDFAGDMMSVNPKGRILTKETILEFKRGYPEISIGSMIDKLSNEKDPIIIQWWKKLEKEKETHNKVRSLLVFKRNRKETCIVMSTRTWVMDLNKPPCKYLIIRYGEIYLTIVKLDDFFEMINVKDMCTITPAPEKPVKLKYRRKGK